MSVRQYCLVFFFFLSVFSALGQVGQSIFHDDFNDERHGWPLEQGPELVTSISNGRYVIDKKSVSGAQLLWNNAIDLKQQEVFEIHSSVKLIAGNQDYGHGITWGGADGKNYYAFTVSGSGSFAVFKYEEGVFFNLKENTFMNDVVHPIGLWNDLKVSRTKNSIQFYVNGKEVFSMPSEKEIGYKTGLIVNMDMKIVVDDYSVRLQQEEEKGNSSIELVWLQPQKTLTTIESTSLDIEVGVKSEALLHRVSLYVNHLLVSRNEGFELVRGEFTENELDEIITEHVLLRRGINEIKVLVEDVQGHLVEEVRMIKVEEKKSVERKDRALLFASDHYDYWTDLVNPGKDADVLAKELEIYYGFEVEVVKDQTAAGIMGKLKNYAKRYYGEQDQLFIFFAGHGKYDEAFGEGYVVCKNSLKSDEGNTSYLSHSTLRTVINNIPCDHVFLMMDVCFGGTFDPNLVSRGHHRGGDDGVYGELSRKQYIQHKLQYITRMYMTSGGKEYVPDGRPGFHSPFVRKILEALRSHGGEDKILTFSEILHYLERVQPEPRWGEFGDNEPGSDFMFIVR